MDDSKFRILEDRCLSYQTSLFTSNSANFKILNDYINEFLKRNKKSKNEYAVNVVFNKTYVGNNYCDFVINFNEYRSEEHINNYTAHDNCKIILSELFGNCSTVCLHNIYANNSDQIHDIMITAEKIINLLGYSTALYTVSNGVTVNNNLESEYLIKFNWEVIDEYINKRNDNNIKIYRKKLKG